MYNLAQNVSNVANVSLGVEIFDSAAIRALKEESPHSFEAVQAIPMLWLQTN